MFSFPFYSCKSPVLGVVPPTARVGLPPQWNLSGKTLIDASRIYPPGELKSSPQRRLAITGICPGPVLLPHYLLHDCLPELIGCCFPNTVSDTSFSILVFIKQATRFSWSRLGKVSQTLLRYSHSLTSTWRSCGFFSQELIYCSIK